MEQRCLIMTQTSPRVATRLMELSDAEPLRIAEERILTLADAVRVLAGGLESRPTREPDLAEAARAARHAHELLLAGGF